MIKSLLIAATIIIGSITGCFAKKETLSFQSLDFLDSKDSSVFKSELVVSQARYFLVHGYKNKRQIDITIDSFAKKINSEDSSGVNQYSVFFYKKSSETTYENLQKNPRVLDRHSNTHDLLFEFQWWNGKFLIRHKFKNGKISEPKRKIEIEDISK